MKMGDEKEERKHKHYYYYYSVNHIVRGKRG